MASSLRRVKTLPAFLLFLAAALPSPAAEPWVDPKLPTDKGLELWFDATKQTAARQARKLPALKDNSLVDALLDGSGQQCRPDDSGGPQRLVDFERAAIGQGQSSGHRRPRRHAAHDRDATFDQGGAGPSTRGGGGRCEWFGGAGNQREVKAVPESGGEGECQFDPGGASANDGEPSVRGQCEVERVELSQEAADRLDQARIERLLAKPELELGKILSTQREGFALPSGSMNAPL